MTSNTTISTSTTGEMPLAHRAHRWTVAAAEHLYGIASWGQGFFGVNKAGHVVVRPHRTTQDKSGGNPVHPPSGEPAADLYEIVRKLRQRGLGMPMILGFPDILARRICDLHETFAQSIAEQSYRGAYRLVYPIKVNQQRHVVDEILLSGQTHHCGLEVGSKSELLAALGQTTNAPDRFIICNGYKDEKYIEYTMLGSKLGGTIIPVIENLRELHMLVDQAQRFDVQLRLGVRVSLHARGYSRWEHSTTDHGKFGLTIPQVLAMVDHLKRLQMLDCLVLVHSHMASQINEIQSISAGATELARVYVELIKMGAPLRYLDVGGGLGVDYDGSQTNREFSINYAMADYTSTLVHCVKRACDDAHVDHPVLVTETGRAVTAHHSMLVFNIHDVRCADQDTVSYEQIKSASVCAKTPTPVLELIEHLQQVHHRPMKDLYLEATAAREWALRMFSAGQINLEQRGLTDKLFWSICASLRDRNISSQHVPDKFDALATRFSDTYLGNLSVFQSLPDSWAINQVFPVMPIHRLNERPVRYAKIADLTCDSDGMIHRFVCGDGNRPVLPVHSFEVGQDYLLGAFLIGAYQETLGDLHNLFGDAHVAHVRVDRTGQWAIDEVVVGDTAGDVLRYVEYDPHQLAQNVKRQCEQAVRANRITESEGQTLARTYESGLTGYAYLE